MSGMSVRFKKDYIVTIDPNPHAMSVSMCPDCGGFFNGKGRSLQESMADSDAEMAKHRCPAREQRTGDETL